MDAGYAKINSSHGPCPSKRRPAAGSCLVPQMEMTIGLKMLSYFAPSAIRTSTTLLITKTVTMNCQLSVEYLTAQQQSGRILDDYRRL